MFKDIWGKWIQSIVSSRISSEICDIYDLAVYYWNIILLFYCARTIIVNIVPLSSNFVSSTPVISLGQPRIVVHHDPSSLFLQVFQRMQDESTRLTLRQTSTHEFSGSFSLFFFNLCIFRAYRWYTAFGDSILILSIAIDNR